MARSPPDLDLPQISHQSLCLAAEIACLAPEITGLMLSPPVTPDRNSTGTPPVSRGCCPQTLPPDLMPAQCCYSATSRRGGPAPSNFR